MATLPSNRGIVTVPVTKAPSHTKTNGIITVPASKNSDTATATNHGILSK